MEAKLAVIRGIIGGSADTEDDRLRELAVRAKAVNADMVNLKGDRTESQFADCMALDPKLLARYIELVDRMEQVFVDLAKYRPDLKDAIL
jgi:hypothetical protein